MRLAAAIACGLFVGCARPSAPVAPAQPNPVTPACAVAPLEKAHTLREDGRLLRAERLVLRTLLACEAPALRSLATTLATTLGRVTPAPPDADAVARAHVRFLLAVAAGERGDHVRARTLFLEAAALAPPHGDALFGAGLAARALGEEPAARALIDRARVALERDGGARAHLDHHDGLDAPLVAARFVGDASLLALASGGEVTLFAGPERRRVRRFTGPATVRALAADAHVVVTAAADGAVRAFDVKTGRPSVVTHHVGDALAVDLSTTGVVASGGTDHVVRLTRLDGASVGALVGHTQAVTAVAFSPDGTQLATAGRDRTVRLWDVSSEKLLRVLTNPGAVQALAWAPKGHLLATASSEPVVRVWDAGTGWPVATLTGHAERATSLAFAPDGRTLASASADHTVRLWDPAAAFALRKTLEGHTGPVLAVAFDPGSSALVSASSDRTAVTWSPWTGAHLGLVTDHVTPIHGLAYASDGTLAAASADASVRVLSPAGASLTTLEGHVLGVLAVAFSADGKRLVSGGEDDAVRLWDPVAGTALGKIGRHKGAVTAVAFTGTGEPLSVGRDGLLVRYPPGKKPIVVRADKHPLTALTLAGGTYVTASDAGVSEPWPVSTPTHALAPLPGGGLAAGHASGAITLFDAGYAHAHDLFGHGEPVRALAVDPIKGWLASGGDDGLVRLWNLVDHSALAADKIHPRGVRALAFSPEGRLASAGDDGVVLVRAGARRLFALHPIGGEPAGFAVTDDGHVQIYGDATRRFLTCAIGPIHHPLALCEEEVVVPDLVRRVLAGDQSYAD